MHFYTNMHKYTYTYKYIYFNLKFHSESHHPWQVNRTDISFHFIGVPLKNEV